jgi:hypothetical protein
LPICGLEDLGFCGKGEAAGFIWERNTTSRFDADYAARRLSATVSECDLAQRFAGEGRNSVAAADRHRRGGQIFYFPAGLVLPKSFSICS